MVGREHHLCYSELGIYLAQFWIPSWCPDIVRLGVSWAVDCKYSVSVPRGGGGECLMKWEEGSRIQTLLRLKNALLCTLPEE